MVKGYELVDSGEGERLERFEDRYLIRPSRLAIWGKGREARVWDNATSRYKHKVGWSKEISPFNITLFDVKLALELQESGQIGFFPEHLEYMPILQAELLSRKGGVASGAAAKVLNLFAYTGLASLVAARQGAEVTHVELSKRVINWAKSNGDNNRISNIRFINEDAISFVEKEVRRKAAYDLIIADPPSFSRVSPKNEWQLEEVLPNLLKALVNLARPKNGLILFSSHLYEFGAHVSANILRSLVSQAESVKVKDLLINEESSQRVLPAGFLVEARG
jgi:23S rRNA (cytosine1962-C5)-methyltransferase